MNKSPRRVYRSAKHRDPEAARIVATALGPGHHVLTQVQGGKTHRGHIARVDAETMTLQLDRSSDLVVIDYNSIDHLEENLSRKAKIWIVIGASAAVIFALWWHYVVDLDD